MEINQRPIKFRAWDKQHKRMVHDKSSYRPIYALSMTGRLLQEDNNNACGDPECCGEYETYFSDQGDFIVLQYTGLNDVNGKEIYEGDILDMYIGTGASDAKQVPYYQVIWVKDNPGFYLADARGFSTTHIFSQPYLTTSKIIGNIYENPELLEEKK